MPEFTVADALRLKINALRDAVASCERPSSN